MEKVMVVLGQSTLETITSNDGQKVFKKLTVELTDGSDTLIAEAYDELAEKLDAHKLTCGRAVSVGVKFTSYNFKNKQGELTKATRIRLMSFCTLN